jgi:predicted metalloprotease with PDZ domain
MRRRDFLGSALAAGVMLPRTWPRPTGNAAVDYALRYDPARPGILAVTVTPPSPVPGGSILIIPRAIPMSYGEAPYDRFVGSVQATSSAGVALTVTREEGPRWRLGESNTTVARVEYTVDLATMEQELLDSSEASKARPAYVGLLGYSVLGYLDGHETLPCQLEVTAPADWPVFSTLAPSGTPGRGSLTASATDFYALADSQLVMGPAIQVRRLSGSIPLFLAAYAEGEVDLSIDSGLIENAFDAVARYFGTIPFPHYTAYLELVKPLSPRHSYGFSMEHLESSTYFLDAARGLSAASTAEQRERNRFNYAHHIAHAWIPKRGYGTGYHPFRWELAPIIDSIWFSEGFGRYAAIMALADGLAPAAAAAYRAGRLAQLRQFLEAIPPFIRDMDLVELSRIGSTRYSSDFRTGQTLFSRGALMAAEMDDAIGWESSGALSLRDALRHIMAWCRGHPQGFTVAELPDLVTEATGTDVRDIMTRWIKGARR